MLQNNTLVSIPKSQNFQGNPREDIVFTNMCRISVWGWDFSKKLAEIVCGPISTEMWVPAPPPFLFAENLSLISEVTSKVVGQKWV